MTDEPTKLEYEAPALTSIGTIEDLTLVEIDGAGSAGTSKQN